MFSKYLKKFALTFYLNGGRQEDRRRRMQNLLLDHGLNEVKRFPAVDPRRVRRLRGYPDAADYAHSLTMRLALREARRRGAPEVMLLHDEIELHPRFREWLGKMQLPEDWGMFHLGAEHVETPGVVKTGVVRCRLALGAFALAVRAPQYRAVMRALGRRRFRAGAPQASVEWRLASLQREMAVYAALPNLAWLTGGGGRFDGDGWQTSRRGVVLAAVQQALKVKPWQAARSQPAVPAGTGKVALLFLTRGSLNQPAVWEEYLAACPERVSIHVHPKERSATAPDWFKKAWLPKTLPTAWGDVSLVKAQLALLKAAFSDPANQAFVFASESCVPVKPLAEFLDRCESAGWRGMMKLELPADVIGYDVSKAKRYTAVPQLPPWVWKLHSQWILLNREMAGALLEEDLTGLFAGSFAPDESYFGTVLALKGYPLETQCLPLDPTWVSWETQPARHPREMTAVTAQEAATFRLGAHGFARKFSARSDIGKWGLHRG